MAINYIVLRTLSLESKVSADESDLYFENILNKILIDITSYSKFSLRHGNFT